MLSSVVDIFLFCLVTFACLANGILSTEVLRNIQPVTNLQPPPLSYLPSTGTPKLSEHVFANQALANGLKDVGATGRGFTEGQIQPGYSYLKPLLIDLKFPFKDQTIKSINDKQRSSQNSKESETFVTTVITRPTVSLKLPNNRTSLQIQSGHHPHTTHRSSYRVVEEHDEHLTDDSNRSGLPHRGKAQTTNPHRNSQDITTAIKALDHFLSGALNDDGYNSALHPPPNPVLALVLSRYGRYVPGARNPRVYAYTAVNNIHNNKPFGSYKLECEEVPTYVR